MFARGSTCHNSGKSNGPILVHFCMPTILLLCVRSFASPTSFRKHGRVQHISCCARSSHNSQSTCTHWPNVLCTSFCIFSLMKPENHSQLLQFIESMSGCQMLSHMLRAEDFTGVALDRRYDPILDLATDEGFKVFRVAQRRLMPHCLAWWGIESKTWLWRGRAPFARTKDVPLGNAG